MNEKFSNYVHEKSFVFTLTRNQSSELIALIERNGSSNGRGTPARNGLARRGLIESHSRAVKIGDLNTRQWYDAPTKAGLLIYQLLVEAGERENLSDLEKEAAALEAERCRLECERHERELRDSIKRRSADATEKIREEKAGQLKKELA